MQVLARKKWTSKILKRFTQLNNKKLSEHLMAEALKAFYLYDFCIIPFGNSDIIC